MKRGGERKDWAVCQFIKLFFRQVSQPFFSLFKVVSSCRHMPQVFIYCNDKKFLALIYK